METKSRSEALNAGAAPVSVFKVWICGCDEWTDKEMGGRRKKRWTRRMMERHRDLRVHASVCVCVSVCAYVFVRTHL